MLFRSDLEIPIERPGDGDFQIVRVGKRGTEELGCPLAFGIGIAWCQMIGAPGVGFRNMGEAAPVPVRQVAAGLIYRDFITVGILVKRLRVANETSIRTVGGIIPDLWIYIQERDVKVGRIQIFNNWSPYLVQDPGKVWIGLEYFASCGDALDAMSERDMAEFAVTELVKLGLVDAADVLDTTVAKMPKAYPAYFGTYDQFDRIRDFTDTLDNLFLIGRNGQHRYNNMDHSMLTAMEAVDNILAGKTEKSNIWAVNTEEAYLEQEG